MTLLVLTLQLKAHFVWEWNSTVAAGEKTDKNELMSQENIRWCFLNHKCELLFFVFVLLQWVKWSTSILTSWATTAKGAKNLCQQLNHKLIVGLHVSTFTSCSLLSNVFFSTDIQPEVDRQWQQHSTKLWLPALRLGSTFYLHQGENI